MRLAIITLASIAAIILGIFTVLSLGCARLNNPGNDAGSVAQEALMLAVDRPETVEIVAISAPDSIFGKQLVSDEEKLVLSKNLMAVTKYIFDHSGNENDMDNTKILDLAERQIKVASFLRAPMVMNRNADHTGWKIKIEYKAVSRNGNPYHSEYWFFLDKESKFIFDSFEIPLL